MTVTTLQLPILITLCEATRQAKPPASPPDGYGTPARYTRLPLLTAVLFSPLAPFSFREGVLEWRSKWCILLLLSHPALLWTFPSQRMLATLLCDLGERLSTL